jgi:hypothetical protein
MFMHIGKFGVALGSVALVLSVFVTSARAADSNVGTWKVNLAKSTYDPGPPPKGPNVLKIEADGDGIKVTNDGVDAQGKATHVTYSAKYDGKDYPETGNPNVDTISIKRIDANTVETTAKKGGKVLVTSRVVVSGAGKVRTTTQNGTNAQGQKVHNVIVADRQ